MVGKLKAIRSYLANEQGRTLHRSHNEPNKQIENTHKPHEEKKPNSFQITSQCKDHPRSHGKKQKSVRRARRTTPTRRHNRESNSKKQ